ncbi:Na+/H+ antiporter subunit E [Eubacteriaceae bacterium ES3]|nr:Na+/H+ antiporter subunit E [Eubacteriaceae bacterium ES3]
MLKVNYFGDILLFTIIWILLNGKFNFLLLVSGIIISILALYFTNKVLLGKSYSEYYHLPLIPIFQYLIYLIFQIFKSGFTSIPKVLKGNCRVKIVDYHTSLDSNLAISLLANAITLTPGTVTIDKNGNCLSILCFADENIIDNPGSESTFSRYEKILGDI